MKAECKLLMLFSWLIACTHCSVRALSYLLTAMNCIVYKQLELEDFFFGKHKQQDIPVSICHTFFF